LQQKPAEANVIEAHTSFMLRYGKYGDGRYLGHLDTVTLLLRSLRASNLRLRLHGKYHPKPRISLSPALPVGIESTCEYAEIEVLDEGGVDAGHVETAQAVKSINDHLPRGLKVLEFSEGTIEEHKDEQTYLLISSKEPGLQGRPWKSKGGKLFTFWQGQGIKGLWQSGLFDRIIKVEEKRIHAGGTDNQCNL